MVGSSESYDKYKQIWECWGTSRAELLGMCALIITSVLAIALPRLCSNRDLKTAKRLADRLRLPQGVMCLAALLLYCHKA